VSEKSTTTVVLDLVFLSRRSDSVAMTPRRVAREVTLSLAERATRVLLGAVKPLDFAQVQRILVAQTGGAGDLMRLMPALMSIRRNFADAAITLLAAPGASKVLDLFMASEMVQELLVYDLKRKHRSTVAKLRLVRELRRRNYDLVYSPDRGNGMREECLMRAMTGAPHRLGFSRGNVGLMNTIHVPLRDHRSITQQNLDILRKAGLTVFQETCEVKVPQADIDSVARKMREGEVESWCRLIIIHPAASWEGSYRAWPMNNYARLIAMVIEEYGAHVIIIGTDGETSDCDALTRHIDSPNVLDLSGRTSLKELAALISMADLLVGNDSGPLNLAAMMGARYVGLFGPTDPRQVLSQLDSGMAVYQELPCQPCYLHQERFEPPCGQPHRPPCMAGLSVTDVFSAVQRSLRQ
jgi:ADP-heptose:LPS heptosyltransferase